MPENKQIQKVLESLPDSPGIYKMLDKEGRVIYVGKAKNITKRVRQYFQKDYIHSTRTRKLLENVSNIEAISVDSELGATILESNLIKQLQPKYNVLMKDDKNYVYIKITREDFPRIQIVRKIEKDNARYIGPKTAAHKVKETLSVLKKIFPFRHCDLDIKLLHENPPDTTGKVQHDIEFLHKNPPDASGKAQHDVKVTHKVIKYPCLDYYIKKCIAPCIGLCNIEQYREIIKNVENFLAGKSDEILKNLHQKMQDYAQKKDFERAAKIRDKIQKIKHILEKQIISDPNQEDKDIINYCIVGGSAYFNLFQIRDGKLIGQENFTLGAEDIEDNDSKEILEAFLQQYYQLATDIPGEILLPHEAENQKQLAEFIDKKIGKKVHLLLPQKGTKNKLLEMSLNNARLFAHRHKPSWKVVGDKNDQAVEELQKLLGLAQPLKRIECYDISHLSGTFTVGSMIVFEKGIPKNNHYRKFQIRTIQDKVDDYKAMEEVFLRRFSKLAEKLQSKEYRFRQASKKDTVFIEKNNKIKLAKTDRKFYILEDRTESSASKEGSAKQLGFIALKEHTTNNGSTNKIAELTNLWVLKAARGHKLGYKLIKNAIEKTKSKRIYCVCKSELKNYYALAGFEEIRKLPEELSDRYKERQKKIKALLIFMVYDKNKHKEDPSFSQVPDLIIVDGGKGQLSVATKILEKLNIKIPHIALAKQLEEIFLPDQKESIILPANNEALKLLQRARNEAHRFAISYNRDLRLKALQPKTKSSLQK